MAYGQQLQFEKFTTANGLPTDRVYTLHMDKKGYIWACTNYGIAKYNGNSFVPVCTNIDIKDRFAVCMFENEKGEIWFASLRANIYKIKNDSAFLVTEFEKVKERQKDTPDVYDLFVDDSQNIFMSTNTNSYKLIYEEEYKVSDLNDYYFRDSTDFVLIQHNKHLLVVKKYPEWSTDQNFYTYKIINGNPSSDKKRIEIKDHGTIRWAKQSDNSIILTTSNEIIKINIDGSSQHLTFKHGILSFSTDEHNNIWVGLDNEGLYKVSPEMKITSHYFSETSINSILFDDQSGLWVSTAGQGVYHCKNINNYSFSNYPELSQTCMIKKIDTSIFIGTHGKLFKMGKNESISLVDLKGNDASMIIDMKAAPDGGFYISCKNSLLKADGTFKKIEPITNEASQNLSSLGIEHNDKGEWFTLGRTGVLKIGEGKTHKSMLLPSRATKFINYKDNCFVVGGSRGLYLLSNDSIWVPEHFKRFEDIYISDIEKSKNGNLWISTLGQGLFRIGNDNIIEAYPEVPCYIIHTTLFINDTTILLCLNTGVFITPISKLHIPKDWYQVHNEESSTPLFVNNRLYISTNSELLSFDLNYLQESSHSKIYFKNAFAEDSIYTDLPLRFEHDKEKIEFYFDLLYYKTKNARIAYELKGQINESGIVEGTKITLNKLPPGNYVLTIYSSISPIQKNEKGTTINFVIEPAFWQTNWFLILMFISGLFFLVLTMYVINLRTKNKERQKAKITRLLAEYKLTALKAQINPHFISNSLSAIQQLILDDKTDKAAQYLAKFSLLIRYVLKYSDKAIVKLSEELGVIDLNVQLETLRFKDDFEIQKIIDKDINPENISVPPLITQPFIENAIWHGLLPLKGKRKPKLTIRISKIEADILICIEDNGVGRNSEKKTQRESQGTQLISNRLENINLLLGTKTAMLKIEDLYDEKRESIGTRVNIVLPDKLNNSEYDED